MNQIRKHFLPCLLCLCLLLSLAFPAAAEESVKAGPPEIITDPHSVEVALGETATFTVVAAGSSLSYQWQYSKDSCSTWTTWTHKTEPTLSVVASATNNGCWYRCIVSNSLGSATTAVVKLTVTGVTAQPVITAQPQPVTVAVGGTATFQVAATGEGLSYQWQYQKSGESAWTSWNNKTSPKLTVTGSNTNNGCEYRCVVSNAAGSVTSNAAKLTVTGAAAQAPVITGQPQNVTTTVGTAVSFQVTATGSDLKYQWQYLKYGQSDWVTWSGKTSAKLAVTASRTNDGCQYRCVVSNAAGSVTSQPARLTASDPVGLPEINVQPKSLTCAMGEQVVFQLTVSGENLSYQWQFKKADASSWSNWSGKTSPKLPVVGSATNNGCMYRCKVSNSVGTVTSAEVKLTVTAASGKPAITAQPKSVTVALGGTASFQVTGSGLSYQWEYSKDKGATWTAWHNKTAAKLTVTGSNTNNGCQYRCVVTNSAGSVTSAAATLTVTGASEAKPTITSQPKSASAAVGQSVVFQVTASGTGLKYQWQYRRNGESSWTTWSGKTSAKLTVTASSTNNGCQYRCVVSNSAGSVNSAAATLTVSSAVTAPMITSQPKSVTANENTVVTFTVKATGGDLSYQWQYLKINGGTQWVDWAGKTNASLNVTAIQENARFYYRCVVSNPYGSVTSDQVTLTVHAVATAKPTITVQPQDVCAESDYVEFSLTATGGDLSYQWQYSKDKGSSWIDWADKTSPALRVYASENNSRLYYRCKVSNSLGTVYSKAVTFYWIRITQQPKTVMANPEEIVSFTVKAEGKNLHYQWEVQWDTEVPIFENAEWPNDKTDTLSVTAADYLDQVQFRCKITDGSGHTVYSDVVMLKVVVG